MISVEPLMLNPYTQAMKNCLLQLQESSGAPELNEANSQFLANMIQGRFLQYLITMICDTNDICDKELEKQLSMALMNILCDKFFAVFREKVRKRPEIVYMIAKRITSIEEAYAQHKPRIDALFRGISRHYFEYQNFKIIVRWITTNPEVEKIVFLSRIQKRVKDASLLKALIYILQNDKFGIAPTVFNRYLKKNKIGRLNSLVNTGDWKIEAAFVQQQQSGMINWRQYVEKI
ncbi:MAG: hypothetical protein HQ517_18230 [SAR324 cluster bacterium]|nr:hypothetical protein [SAR324 cluster bacterium]